MTADVTRSYRPIYYCFSIEVVRSKWRFGVTSLTLRTSVVGCYSFEQESNLWCEAVHDHHQGQCLNCREG
jgi:hypothetical protein